MSADKSLAHTRWNCRYYIIFISKCRRKKIYGIVKEDVVAIIKCLCKMKDVAIIKGHECINYIHSLVKIPPKISVLYFVGYLKGKSALMLFGRHEKFKIQI